MSLPEQQRQKIHKWLKDDLNQPIYAEAYYGAAKMMDSCPPGYITFVSHAGRDLMNRLAQDENNISGERVQYPDLVDRVQEVWQASWNTTPAVTENPETSFHAIPFLVCDKIKELLREHSEGRRRSESASEMFFATYLDYKDREKIPGNLQHDWKEAKKWFNKHAHLREKPFNEETTRQLRHHFRILEALFHTAASSHIERIGKLDEILEDTNG